MKKCYLAFITILCFCICLQGCSSAPDATDTFSVSKGDYLLQTSEINLSNKSEKEFLSTMEFVCENSKFALYYDTNSLSVALVDKSDSNVYFSNPYDASSDPYYVDDLKNRLNSQIVLDFIDRKSNVKQQLFSSSDCVELGQYNIKQHENGLNIKMAIGEIKEEYFAPDAMSVESFEKFISNMDDLGKMTMETFYSLTDINELEGGLEKQNLIENFPSLKEEKLYIALELTERDKKMISEYLTAVGYTENDYVKDVALGSSSTGTASKPCVKLELRYLLDEKGLTVTIPSNSIEYDDEKFAVTDISVLEFFASDKPQNEGDGYLFIPDGSGALISIDDSNENRKRSISGDIYGKDFTIINEEETDGEQFLLPVYGINKNNGSCLFAEIVSGDEISTVMAVLGAPNTQYFRVYNTFRFLSHCNIVTNTKVSSTNSSISAYKISETKYKNDLSIRYTPLSGKDEGYVKMAQQYRKELINSGLKENKENNILKTEINLLGTAVGEDTFLGLEVNKDFVFTDYNSVEKIVDWFKEKEINNLRVVYTGWQKYGLNTGVSGKQKISNALGSKSDWKKLNKYLEKNAIDLIPATDLVFSSYQYAFDGFSKSSDASRTMADTYAGVYKFENAKTEDTLNYLISPMRYIGLWKDFFKSADKFVTKNVLLEGIGSNLASDAKNDDISNRTTSLEAVDSVFANQVNSKKLWFDSGNKYILPYATGVTETILNNSGFAGETATVPFYQIATDGLIARSSRDINLVVSWEKEILSCVETHTSPRFTLAFDNTELLKDTDFTKYYSVDFTILRDRIVKTMTNINEKLSSVDGEFITNHRIMAEDVTVTTYSNGNQVLVNKSDKDFCYGDIKVKAMDFTVLEKGEK